MNKIMQRRIIGYEDYLIATDGSIFSCKSNKFLKPTMTKLGYLNVRLSNGQETKSFPLHRLVAVAFLPNSDPNKDQVNHLNSFKNDNRVENLEWVSGLENIAHLILNKVIYLANLSREKENWIRSNIDEIAKNFQVLTKALDEKKLLRLVILQTKTQKLILRKVVPRATSNTVDQEAWLLAAARKAQALKK